MPIDNADNNEAIGNVALDISLWHLMQEQLHPNETEESVVANSDTKYAKDYEGSHINLGRTTLWYALNRRFSSIVNMLLERGAKDSAPKAGMYCGYSVLMKALEIEDLDTAKILLDRGARDSVCESGDNPHSNGVSALWMALKLLNDYKNAEPQDEVKLQKLEDIVTTLIPRSNPKAINTSPRNGRHRITPLHLAYAQKNYSLLEILITHGAIDSIIPPTNNDTVLEKLLDLDRFDLAHQLASSTPSYVYADTLVILKAIDRHDYNLAISLINKGVGNVIATDGPCKGISAVWLALQNLSREQYAISPDATKIQILTEIIDKLMKCGARDTAPAQGPLQGFSLLFLFLLKGNKEFATMLVDRGAKNSIVVAGECAGDSTLRLAFGLEDDYIVQSLIERGATDSIVLGGDRAGESALFRALLKNYFSVARELINRGATNTTVLAGPHKGLSCIGLCIEKGLYAEIKDMLKEGTENKSILDELCQFSAEIIKSIITLKINGADAPVFAELKKYKCPISGRLILNPIKVGNRMYDRESFQITVKDAEQEIPPMDRKVAYEIKELIKKVGNVLNSVIKDPEIQDVCNPSKTIHRRVFKI